MLHNLFWYVWPKHVFRVNSDGSVCFIFQNLSELISKDGRVRYFYWRCKANFYFLFSLNYYCSLLLYTYSQEARMFSVSWGKKHLLYFLISCKNVKLFQMREVKWTAGQVVERQVVSKVELRLNRHQNPRQLLKANRAHLAQGKVFLISWEYQDGIHSSCN